MDKGHRAGNEPIEINVIQKKIMLGVLVGLVRNNLFAITLIKVQNLDLLYTKLKKLKKYFSAFVNKLMISHFVMDRIVNK